MLYVQSLDTQASNNEMIELRLQPTLQTLLLPAGHQHAYIVCSGLVRKEMTSKESVFVLQRTLRKRQTKQNGLLFSLHCGSDEMVLLHAWNTKSMRVYLIDSYIYHLCFALVCGREKRKSVHNKFRLCRRFNMLNRLNVCR